MPSPFSLDLRIKAVAAVEKGEKQSKVARMFGIHRDTLHAWLKQKKATSNLEPKTGYQIGYNHAVTDLEEFKKFVEKHQSLTCKAMGDLWGCSASAIRRNLKHIGFSHKKKRMVT